MPKSFTLDGKRYRVHPKVPAGEINWLMQRQHVGLTDAEVRVVIASRATGWPKAVERSAADYAVYCHRKNQKLYSFVQRGS